MTTKESEIIPIVIYQNIFFYQILKKCLIEKIDDFLKISKKTLKRKKS